MNNTIDNLSFKATLTPLIKIKNRHAFVEAKNLFKDATKEYPHDILCITENKLGESSIHLSKHPGGTLFSAEEVCTRNLDKEIETIGINKFANKLVSTFKALKLQAETQNKINDINVELVRLKSLQKLNKNIAKNWKEEGKDVIANRYETLAKFNKNRIAKLNEQKTQIIDKYNKRIDGLSKKVKEIIQLKIN